VNFLAKKTTAKSLIGSELVVLNLGLDIFRQSLESQQVKCVQVDLQTAPKLEKKLADALDRLL
jgi:hypothetical protein